ncbi:thiamine biosynthesis protein ApbE [Bordetella genomosp. 9]|uniref:FAD:protein FMN transferase n=2 Tax=Bordetella genomosp. 9 TaxID=1416803 RepID=A0A1W6Z0A0_9BORD|nr:FAD:protein FMN transferase [Bordetella genomosp. 9]ARP86624.1 thiamine biosynthesis protein ApbE [Bordetella genomosp. 9]
MQTYRLPALNRPTDGGVSAPRIAPIRARYDGVRGLACALAGATMGTTWSARLALPLGVNEAAVRRAVQDALDGVVAQMSHWETGSAISRFNRAGRGWVPLPAGMRVVLDCALSVAAHTDGAYDPTIGALAQAWGFAPHQRAYEPPSGDAIAAALARCGWRRLRRDAENAWQDGGVHLDFSSIAKGYGVDRAAAALDALGVTGYLVEVGGELRARGARPDGLPWRVAVEWPDSGAHAANVVLQDAAIATSGDYRRYFLHAGKRHSHTLDPRNGRPVDNGVASVTVLHPECMQADAWATALTVLGPDEGRRCADRHGLAALFIVRREGKLDMQSTALWRARQERVS